MRKLLLFVAVGLLTVSTAMAQSKKVYDLEPFDDVKLDGNIRLFLEQDRNAVVEIEAKRDSHIDDYTIEVIGGTLYIQFDEHDRFSSAPKIHVYLGHPGIAGIDMDGLVHVYTNDPVESERLRIKGDGLIRGDIEVDVKYLKIDLDGLCTMTVSGQADESVLKLDGVGKIRAQDLETSVVKKSADGLASIRVGG